MRGKIIALIEDVLMLEAGSINEDTQIDDVEAWDSLAHVMIIGELEDKLGLVIPIDEAIEIVSVKEIFEKTGV